MADISVAIEAAKAEKLRAQHNPPGLSSLIPPVRHVNPGTPNFDWRGWEQIIYWLEELEREQA